MELSMLVSVGKARGETVGDIFARWNDRSLKEKKGGKFLREIV